MRRNNKWLRCCFSMMMAATLTVTGVVPATTMVATAAETESVNSVITSMAYDDGPTFTVSGLSEGSFGFRMPVFNGGSSVWGDVAADLGVNVKVNGAWVDIDSIDKYVYNSNWGHWSDSGFNGFWFTVTESTYLQLYSKSNPSVTLEYNLILNTADTSAVTALSAAAGTTISANRTGSGFIAFPNAIANGGSFPTNADNLVAYVKKAGEPDSAYVNIDNNAESGWVYNTNFGIEQYGYWFKVEESGSINVKLALKDNENVSLVYDITYSDTVRDSYKVYANGATTITADAKTGATGVVFPWLGGTTDANLPTNKELDTFVIEYYNESTGSWVEFANAAESGWYYQGNGYVNYSSKNQWGYFDDYVFGLWFQPVTEDFKLRIGYPESGVKGDAVGSNYIEYQFIGAPNAYRPEDVEIGDISVGGEGSDPYALDGWDLYFNDEFSGNTLDMSNWSYNTGYFLDPSDPNTFGWGNNEEEYYTDDADNIFVNDGALHLVAKYDPYTFTCTDAAQTKVTADYSSGKIISKDKVSFTYGRVDFRAKLPAGQGLWPALWLLPNDESYGTWAASGEIDVMEARGRVTNATSGTIHYGGAWPNNKYTGTDYIFPEGSTFDDGYHVYSVIWEEDNITWYVDGEFFQYIPKGQWYSANSNSDTAPFDQDFYLIMNLAVGGWFDGGVLPTSDFSSAEMLVDYVRVYKEEGSVDAQTVPIEGLELDTTSVTLKPGQTANLNKVYAPSNTTQRNVNWTSSNEAVATVSAGQITAIADGTTVITATSAANPAITATCTVTVTNGEVGGETGSGNEGTTGGETGSGNEGTTGGETGNENEGGDVTDTEIVVTDEYGVIRNANGTLTFYVEAQDTAFAPMLFWGVNKTNPSLSQLGGVFFEKNTALGENYFSFTTTESFAGTDTVSYMFSYTPLEGAGRMDTEIMNTQVADMSDGTAKDQNGNEEDTNTEIGDGNEEETEEESGEDVGGETDNETDKEVVGSEEYGVLKNADGTVTFYVYANENEAAPLVFWGLNMTNPTLSQLGGYAMEKTGDIEGYYTFTTAEKISSGTTVSYMYGYTPLGETGRRDTIIVTETMK
ncbi:MAG: family 16 glycosylhydrolase [Lachnospiraceae bacterium]|nr:family 16 glycosylhydrolase [Lachnospiraceae bacterium]